MKLIYSFGGPGETWIHLDARVNYVTPGAMEIPGQPKQYPVLVLEYDLKKLGPLSLIFGQMEKRSEVPEVHIWDMHKAEPEVAVFFRTRNPEKALLDQIAGKTGEVLNAFFESRRCEQLFAVAEVNLGQDQASRVISLFEACGHFLTIEVREVGNEDESHITRFVVQDLNRSAPRFAP